MPDTPYAMWVRGELAEYLHLPKDGTRVEVVGAEIVVSPGPSDREIDAEIGRLKAKYVMAHQVDLVVEVTSCSNAADDREPGPTRTYGTKWSGYAHLDIPYYLLVDRAPSQARATLFTDPDQREGTYTKSASWAFGKTITLPEPFGFEISTEGWEPWDDGPR
ncbi:Uma2 family endonuclease [Actinomadura scrupuli]|uniref:Uma2 family endonuclease n=1 Tax=Actinomadura scrupuli TaxID=559629 RepID=UPI003D95169D